MKSWCDLHNGLKASIYEQAVGGVSKRSIDLNICHKYTLWPVAKTGKSAFSGHVWQVGKSDRAHTQEVRLNGDFCSHSRRAIRMAEVGRCPLQLTLASPLSREEQRQPSICQRTLRYK